MMKTIATITGILLLISAFVGIVNQVWNIIEGLFIVRFLISNILYILSQFVLGLFMMQFASNSK